jgi:glycosyltransferase involved in cell wall biosynthesis
VRSGKLLFVFSTLAVGGAERQLAWLAPGLEARGNDVLVATLRERGRYYEELREAGVATTFVGMRSRWDVRGFVRALRLRHTRPDVVVTQSIDAHIVGHAIARRSDAAHVAIEQGGPGIHTSRHRRGLRRLVAPRVDRVIPVSASQVPELVRLGYKESSVRVIPNGSAPPATTRHVEDIRNALGLGADDVVALLVASLRPEKRPDVFVEAVGLARARDPRLRGVIAGDGPLRERILSSATNGDVLLLGERQDVADLMTCADVVCLSSDVEGIPLALVEAMALGRPIVATDVGGVTEVVEPSSTGLLVPAGDPAAFSKALLELADDAAKREAMGARAFERFQRNFTAEQMIDRYAAVLAEVVEMVRASRSRSSG